MGAAPRWASPARTHAPSPPHEAHARVLRTGIAERLETVSLVLHRWIEVDLTPTSGGGLSVAFRDIDARKRAEAALRESEARLSLAILDMGVSTAGPTGKLLLTLLGGIATWEREIMLERQREGIAKAKAEGHYKGRTPTARAKGEEVRRLAAEGLGATVIAKQLGIGRASVYRILDGAATGEGA